MSRVTVLSLLLVTMMGSAYGAGIQHDLFIAGGQSNANANWQKGIKDTLTASGKYANPELVIATHSGNPLYYWYQTDAGKAPRQANYLSDFYDPGTAAATLEQRVKDITAAGDTYTIRGFFWFQGETDAANDDGINKYKARFEGMLATIKSDLGISYDIPVGMTLIWFGNGDAAALIRRDNLRAVQQAIPNDYPKSFYIDSSTYTRGSDNLHLIPSESIRLGSDTATKFITATAVPEPVSLTTFGFLGVCATLRRPDAQR